MLPRLCLLALPFDVIIYIRLLEPPFPPNLKALEFIPLYQAKDSALAQVQYIMELFDIQHFSCHRYTSYDNIITPISGNVNISLKLVYKCLTLVAKYGIIKT